MTVEVEHIWKTFQIPHEKRTTFYENLIAMMRPNQYETFTVLEDVSFKVDEGECVGIIGDNGSGKSTLLKIIANILRPTKGTIKVKGKIMPFLELGVGFQPDLTVRENIEVYGSIMGLSRRDVRNRIDGIIEFSGLHKFEDAKLKNLSSGMQVRLAFSTAIQTDPDILLVDEVLAVGDIEFQQRCYEIFEHYKADGVTILFVSHDLGAVRRFCDKTLLLRRGRVIELGDTNEIVDKYIYNSHETDMKQAPSQNVSRWGNKKIEITGVNFIDKNGRKNDNFIFGDPIIVRIFYQSNEVICSPIFGIIFYNQKTYCYGTATKFKEYDLGELSGKGYIDFIVDRLPFLSGKFDVTVAVASSDLKTQYDWHDRLYSFYVNNPTLELGIFSVDCRWSIVKHV